MINQMVVRNLLHRPVRTVLSVLAVAVEVAMILMIVGSRRACCGNQSGAAAASAPTLSFARPPAARR